MTVANETGFKAGEWLLLADYGVLARRNMVVSWSCVIALSLVVSIWLPMSALSFQQASVARAASSLVHGAAAFALYLAVSHRLRNNKDPVAAYLSTGLERFALLFRGCLLIGAIGSAGLIFTYLATASAPPLKDAFLAELDGYLGFHWPSFLRAINDRPFLADLLVKAYVSTAAMTQGVVIWLSMRGQGERLSEFLAVLCLSSLGLAVGMLLAPAAGAFIYFEPARELFNNFTPGRDMWPFLDAFNRLRDGSLTEIDISAVQGVVSFPSFHTMLGIVTTYALRDTRTLFIPAAIINGLMVVATLPVGGHYLVDTLAGAAISIAACHGLRHGFGNRASSRQSIGLSSRAAPALILSAMPLLSRLKSGTREYVFVMIAACLVTYIVIDNLRGQF